MSMQAVTVLTAAVHHTFPELALSSVAAARPSAQLHPKMHGIASPEPAGGRTALASI